MNNGYNDSKLESRKSQLLAAFRALDFDGSHLMDPALFAAVMKHFQFPVDQRKLQSLIHGNGSVMDYMKGL